MQSGDLKEKSVQENRSKSRDSTGKNGEEDTEKDTHKYPIL